MISLRIYFIFILFLNSFSRATTITILPFFFIGQTPVWPNDVNLIGIAIACYPLGSILFSSLIGRVSDLNNRHYILRLSICIVIISYIFVIMGIIFKNKLCFFMGLFLSGISESSVVISKSIICDISSNIKKIFNLTSLEIGAGCGWFLGPLLGAILYMYGYDANNMKWFPFGLIGIGYGVLFIVEFLFKGRANSSFSQEKGAKVDLIKKLPLVFLVWICYVFACEIFIHLLSIYLVKIHLFNIISAGQLFSLMGLIHLLVTIFVAMPMVKNVSNPKKIIQFSYLLQALSVLLFLSAKTTILLGIGSGLFVVGQSFSVPSSIALLSSYTKSSYRGMVIGVSYTLQSIAVVFVGLVILPSIIYSINVPYIISICLFLMGFLMVLLLPNNERPLEE